MLGLMVREFLEVRKVNQKAGPGRKGENTAGDGPEYWRENTGLAVSAWLGLENSRGLIFAKLGGLAKTRNQERSSYCFHDNFC